MGGDLEKERFVLRGGTLRFIFSERFVLRIIDNPNGKYPRITLSNVTHGGDNGLASTFWMRNGNYIRLKTAQLGYTLPKQWLRTINIERVRLFVEGSNLFTIDSLPTGIDPESPGVNNGYYPQQRTFLGGINITF